MQQTKMKQGSMKPMPTLVQFGAGNIGRSFIGQLFATSGYEVIFIDVAKPLVEALNARREYNIVIKRSSAADEVLTIRNVYALDGNDHAAVAEAVADTDYVATSVGLGALPHIFPVLARGIELRAQRYPGRPLDIIIAENIHDGARYFRQSLEELLPPGFPLAENVGLVETSIGKMVPIMRKEDLATDPLLLFAEEYNELIVDKHGFRGLLPQIPTLNPVENIKAYVDRKLFIHNLGHAAAAYFGFSQSPGTRYIWQALELPGLASKVRTAMRQSAAALVREYPNDLTLASLEGHIDDLLRRFANKALGDTIYRVGRDLYRKLARNDRLIGAILLAARHDLPYSVIAEAVRAAISFRAVDEEGRLYPRDTEFIANEVPKGLAGILRDVCGLRESDVIDREVIARILY
jgi:mannitol-1-phosphate 5-dehydrogenase